MKRRAVPPRLAVVRQPVSQISRVERGAGGLRFAPTSGPTGPVVGDAVPLEARAGAPLPAREIAVVASGALLLVVADGIATSLKLPEALQVHDRRPPGLSHGVGAPLANAALLQDEGGWRAVVLPSLGDLAADLGPGPVAIRADGRELAVAVVGGIERRGVGEDGVRDTLSIATEALCYAGGDGIAVAAGARAGPPGVEPAAGSPIVALAGAARAPRAAARHADGSVSVWELGGAEPLGHWVAPLPGPLSLALDAAGERVALGTPLADPPAAMIVRARDGATLRYVEGARAIAPAPEGDALAVGGDWGVAWLTPVEETA